MEQKKREFRIKGYSVYTLIVYFTIYSIVGFFIETLFGMIRKGVIESRQSFLYGPFCAIYGLGAVVMIITLRFCPKNFKSLFIGGFLVGSILEYVVSAIGEFIFHVKWWDYSNLPLNINGRICIYFSIFWGILAVVFMQYVHPRVDKLLGYFKNKFSIRKIKIMIIIIVLLQVIDFLITAYALEMFITRKVCEYNLEVNNIEEIRMFYNEVYNNEAVSKFINKFFNDEKMIKTFPNLKIKDVNGNMIYFDTLVGDIKPYFYKFENNF